MKSDLEENIKAYLQKTLGSPLDSSSSPGQVPQDRKIRVFDFDDTLAKTKGKVRVKKSSGEVLVLTPGEYALYQKEPEDEMDYSDFRKLIDASEIGWMTNILRKVVKKYGTTGAMILTARATTHPVEEFFELFDLPRIPIVALNSSDPAEKAKWIEHLAQEHKYSTIEFFDDSPKNVEAVANVQIPGVKIISRLIQHRNEG